MLARLTDHRTTRFVLSTAALGSLTDWTLFATMVVTVDQLTGGSPWATALVLISRILPGIAFAPLAARRVDGTALDRTLRRHETLRITAVATLAIGFALKVLPLVFVAILALEFAAAIQAAARESLISRHVPRPAFTAVNTVTAVLSYGLLPVGALVIGLVGSATGWGLALAGYTALRLAYLRVPLSAVGVSADVTELGGAHEPNEDVGPSQGSLWRTVVGAAFGLLPVVALFTVAPDLAEHFLGDRTATGILFTFVLAGGALGFAATNLLRARAEVGMATAAAGLAMAAAGVWQAGLVALGFGAGVAYLGLQTRLQHQASDPSQFAGAFAVLKAGSGVAALSAPAVVSVASAPSVLPLGVIVCLIALAVVSDIRWIVQRPLRWLLVALVRIEVTNPDRRVSGPSVVVSNHPHWLDGAVVKLADESLRPIARWQKAWYVRTALWIGGCVVTTAQTDQQARPAFEQAADHLRSGGRIWLAPEGGSHQDRYLREPRTGAVRMAHAAGAPIQPLAVRWIDDYAGPALGRWRPWRRPAVELTWGERVATTGDVQRDGDAMMSALADASGLPYQAAALVAA